MFSFEENAEAERYLEMNENEMAFIESFTLTNKKGFVMLKNELKSTCMELTPECYVFMFALENNDAREKYLQMTLIHREYY